MNRPASFYCHKKLQLVVGETRQTKQSRCCPSKQQQSIQSANKDLPEFIQTFVCAVFRLDINLLREEAWIARWLDDFSANNRDNVSSPNRKYTMKECHEVALLKHILKVRMKSQILHLNCFNNVRNYIWYEVQEKKL